MAKSSLKHPIVKRGEVYRCDFNQLFEHEQARRRYAIIIQNDIGNKFSPNTIVVACTASPKTELPTHYTFNFSYKNMVDYLNSKVSGKTNTVLGECIQTVSKSRLVEYLGTMTKDFMDKEIQPIIDKSLALKRKTEIITQNLNLSLIKILSFVDINELISISNSLDVEEEKISKILQLFGFKYTQSGYRYLLNAVCIFSKLETYDLETISQKISETEKYPTNPLLIQRLIIELVEKRFGLESVTIDFIRLLNCLLKIDI